MKYKKNFFLWVLLFIFLTTYSFDFSKNIKNLPFSIKNIEIYGVKNSDKNKIQKKLDQFKGRSIVLIDRRRLRDTIKDFEFVKELKVKKIYPDTIKVTVTESFPIAVFIDEDKKKYVLTDSGEIIKNNDGAERFNALPSVYGKDAEKNFYIFYRRLKSTDFRMKLIEQFNYFGINRWDIILKNDKTIKLPNKNYENSIKKFLSIYDKENFKNFKIFDFRIKGQLILK